MGPGKQQGANWIWPSVTADDQPSVWRRRGQRTKIKTEHRTTTTTKFLYKQPSSLLQTLNEQGLHDALIKCFFLSCEDLASHAVLTLSSLQLPKKIPDVSNTDFPIKKSTFAQKVES